MFCEQVLKFSVERFRVITLAWVVTYICTVLALPPAAVLDVVAL